VIKKILLPGIFLLAVALQTGWAQYTSTNAIVSNDIYFLEGSGDTLWMLSSKGVNYTTNLSNPPVEWSGFKDLKGWTLTYGGGYTLIRTTPDWSDYEKPGVPAKLWLFNIRDSQKQTFVDLPFNTTDLNDTAVFQAADAAWFKGSFWIACMHGGLVQFDVSSNNKTIFYPGKNKIGYTAATFKDSVFHDSTRAIAVATDNTLIWIACRTRLWTFNLSDTTWTSISDSTVTVREYIDIEARSHNDTSVVYATIVETDTTKFLYRYNSVSNRWDKFIDDQPLTVALSDKNHVYVVHKKKDDIFLYLDTLSNTGLSNFYISGNDFEYRINQATDDVIQYDISDLHYSVNNGNNATFAVATDKGLFYSINEHYDEENNIPFKYERRSDPLSPGLEQTYAVPGIINNYNPSTTFAYNLSKNDKVTIDIFDFNMDHVVRIIDEAPRRAGKNKTSGRSTVPSEDFWDGTVNNSGGRIVAPGVYFYRIKTKEGKRTFGKVIVAKN
jgi:hypothetical protein